jgi:hypothetical protein
MLATTATPVPPIPISGSMPARILQPRSLSRRTCPTFYGMSWAGEHRLKDIRRLTHAGVPCGDFLAPILPGITDAAASIDAVAAGAKAHGAASFGSAVQRLAPLIKEHYVAFIAEAFPDLLPHYERAYAGTTIAPDYQAAIERRVGRIRERHGFADDAMQDRWNHANATRRIAEPPAVRPGQLALPLQGHGDPWLQSHLRHLRGSRSILSGCSLTGTESSVHDEAG